MHCPKCHGKFEHVETPLGIIERCTTCKGLWFDALEHKDIKDIAKVVDTGDKELGEFYSEITDINCPVCPNTKMISMVDSKQTHIEFESCPKCSGRFYDAGEYIDFATISFKDLLKRAGLIKKKKPLNP